MDRAFRTLVTNGRGGGVIAMRVVVPAFRATSTLPACLKAITASVGIEDYQIFVVDDGENGDLETLLAPYPVTIIRTGGSGSAAIARNRGAEGATDDILVFIDADVEVEPDAIRRIIAPIRADLAEATVGNYSSEISGMRFAQGYKQLYLSRVYSRHSSFIRNHFWSALAAVRSAVFFRLGGFEARFRGACNEDTELGQRLTQAGSRILAVPEAKARNLKPYDLCSLVRNDLRKGISTVELFLGKAVSLTDNRHSSARDIAAVGLSGPMSCLLAALLGPWSSSTPLAALLSCVTLLYCWARWDLLVTFGKAGHGFLLRAIPLMYLLDLVRVVCLTTGVLLLVAGHLRGRVRRQPAAAVIDGSHGQP